MESILHQLAEWFGGVGHWVKAVIVALAVELVRWLTRLARERRIRVGSPLQSRYDAAGADAGVGSDIAHVTIHPPSLVHERSIGGGDTQLPPVTSAGTGGAHAAPLSPPDDGGTVTLRLIPSGTA
jgi:hypothetical protein